MYSKIAAELSLYSHSHRATATRPPLGVRACVTVCVFVCVCMCVCVRVYVRVRVRGRPRHSRCRRRHCRRRLDRRGKSDYHKDLGHHAPCMLSYYEVNWPRAHRLSLPQPECCKPLFARTIGAFNTY